MLTALGLIGLAFSLTAYAVALSRSPVLEKVYIFSVLVALTCIAIAVMTSA